MVSQRTKDKIDSWKRSIINNWRLYKRSTIGLVGAGIIAFFVLIAVVTPIIQAIDGLDGSDDFIKDPIRWTAPNEDIVEIKYTRENYWLLTNPNGSEGVTPSNSLGTFVYGHEHINSADGIRMIYLPTEEGVLYALNTGKDKTNWKLDLNNGSITTQPVAVNMDANPNPSENSEKLYVFVGTEDGYFFAIEDVRVTGEIYSPIVRKSVFLDGTPVLPHVFFDDGGTTQYFDDDVFYLGTEGGSFYALSADRTDLNGILEIVWKAALPGHFIDGPAILTTIEDVTKTEYKMAMGNTDGDIYTVEVDRRVLSVKDTDFVRLGTPRDLSGIDAPFTEHNDYTVFIDNKPDDDTDNIIKNLGDFYIYNTTISRQYNITDFKVLDVSDAGFDFAAFRAAYARDENGMRRLFPLNDFKLKNTQDTTTYNFTQAELREGQTPVDENNIWLYNYMDYTYETNYRYTAPMPEVYNLTVSWAIGNWGSPFWGYGHKYADRFIVDLNTPFAPSRDISMVFEVDDGITRELHNLNFNDFKKSANTGTYIAEVDLSGDIAEPYNVTAVRTFGLDPFDAAVITNINGEGFSIKLNSYISPSPDFEYRIVVQNDTTRYWVNNTGSSIRTKPAIFDSQERVLVACRDPATGRGLIKAYDIYTGKLVNQSLFLTDNAEGVLYSPYVQENNREIYIGVQQGENGTEDAYGKMWALRGDFSVKWMYQTTAPVVDAPIFFKRDQNTYVGCTDGRLYSLRSGSGGDETTNEGVASIFWQIKLPPEQDVDGAIYTTPLIIEPSDPLRNEFISPAAYVVTEVEQIDENGVVTTETRMYAVSTDGKYLAPLPPTWAISLSKGYQDEYGFPSSGNFYILGTDHEGKDIFSQLMVGTRIALLVGFSAAFFSITIGTIIGLISGYFGGNVDNFLMRAADVVLTLPFLPLVIILASILGPSVWNIVLAIALVGWPGIARTIRAETLSLKERPFIESAKITGASALRIMFRHIAPNVMPLAFLFAMFSISGAILTEASLSFIGLGDPTTMSWGMMLYFITHTGKTLTAWWWLGPPGVAITLVCLGFFLIGRAFDEIVNPRLRER